MIEEPKALRITRHLRRPTEDQIAGLQGFPTGFVLDAMMGAGAMDARIGPCPDLDRTICGPALVAGNRPGDLLATFAAIRFVQPGDVVVAGFDGFQGCAAAGDRVMGMLRNAGAVGFVTDGPLRDHAGLMAIGLPAWATGLTPGSPVARGPGTLGLPIRCGGQRVENGDMIVADRDGVVVVPFDLLDHVIAAVAKVAETERALDAEVEAGLTSVGLIDDMIERGDDIDWV